MFDIHKKCEYNKCMQRVIGIILIVIGAVALIVGSIMFLYNCGAGDCFGLWSGSFESGKFWLPIGLFGGGLIIGIIGFFVNRGATYL